ncbi:secondary thiamine-phosphate synthase enzyme YjbQ [Candidatus Woesearchaeota archaeon]|nr:secondary thiamine-phosphate synthase enzyme YjbQ [Candidatus Woesearchaeota archaeon]
MQILKIKTSDKEELIDITDRISKLINIKEGICFIFIRHTTAALLINENESGIKEDIAKILKSTVPEGKWEHNKIDDNATSHLKSAFLNSSLTIPISDNKLMLGTYQTIFLAEFDGPRERELVISFI